MENLEAFDSRVNFSADVNQYLTFTFGREEYGVEIERVQEVRGYSPITPVPNAPPHLKGVMNLRGAIIPVVDLRARFGMPAIEYHRFNVIVVVTMGSQVRGLIVDAVSDVRNIPKKEVQPPPDLGQGADGRFVKGLAQAGDKVMLLLDIDKVLGHEVEAVV